MARLMFYTGLVVGDIDMKSPYYHMESEEISMSDYLIETKKLTKIYGEQAAVKEVDLHVKKGRIYGLLGRNGDNMLGRDFLCKIRKNVSTP